MARAVLAGDVRAAARLMRDAEDDVAGAREALRVLYAHTGRARLLGVTGAPGVGKSTLVDRLVERLRAAGRTVGVVAVDPSSPFTGGAILGDRVRMQRHSGDRGVYIRSMATRGALGGLARATMDVVRVLDAMGFDDVLVETVGVGQDEVDVSRIADAVLVVLVPGLGDEVQSLKAGILEIADVFVVNKSDREGADRVVQELNGAMSLGSGARADRPSFVPAIVKTVASRGEGVDALVGAVDAFLAAGEGWAAGAARRRAQAEVQAVVEAEVRAQVAARLADGQVLDDLVARRRDPWTVAAEILAEARARA
ncbi:MAG TPA: methylmalonyl Co-A mutase-associated GTPase MeaB, partial [Myxococcota bacterium]|nr:methylmalonyl Co-A mutase-associated GTPase MeaB [Myxococcota bacterium]